MKKFSVNRKQCETSCKTLSGRSICRRAGLVAEEYNLYLGNSMRIRPQRKVEIKDGMKFNAILSRDSFKVAEKYKPRKLTKSFILYGSTQQHITSLQAQIHILVDAVNKLNGFDKE